MYHFLICVILSSSLLYSAKENTDCSYSALSLVASVLSLLSLPLAPYLASTLRFQKKLLFINEKKLQFMLIRILGDTSHKMWKHWKSVVSSCCLYCT